MTSAESERWDEGSDDDKDVLLFFGLIYYGASIAITCFIALALALVFNAVIFIAILAGAPEYFVKTPSQPVLLSILFCINLPLSLWIWGKIR